MVLSIVEGDLLDQQADIIVNAWNQNFIPWWLLLPHGVSGAIKKHGGLQPFIEVGKFGPLKPGQAVHTTAGKLPFRYIIHVAGINIFWTATKASIADSTANALSLAQELGCKSIAFPIIGAGAGGMKPAEAEAIMVKTIEASTTALEVILVRFKKQ